MFFDEKEENFYLNDNKIFDFKHMKWLDTSTIPEDAIKITSSADALKKLQKSKNKIKFPIGVIGSNEPTIEQYQIAEKLGNKISELGFIVMCGGRAGVMEAVCKGVAQAGGISIGLLPETNADNANNFVTIPLATGIGIARNSIIAAASLCLIAIGGGYGTLSEIAYGLQFKKKVFSINSSLKVEDTITCQSETDIINNICNYIFNVTQNMEIFSKN